MNVNVIVESGITVQVNLPAPNEVFISTSGLQGPQGPQGPSGDAGSLSGVVFQSETGNFITTSQTGSFGGGSTPTGNLTGAFYPLSSNPSSFLTGFNSGIYVLNSSTGSFVTISQTGQFYSINNPSGFITGIDLSSYITNSQTGNFYNSNNPSGFITGVNLTSYITSGQTGIFITTGMSGQFASNANLSSTGFALQSEINIINNQTGQFASNTNLISTGNTLQTEISSLNNWSGNSTGLFYPLTGNPSGFLQNSQTGNFATIVNLTNTGSTLQSEISTLNTWSGSSTGLFYPLNSNPSAYITGFNSGLYTLNSNTGIFLTNVSLNPYATTASLSSYVQTGSTGNFVTVSQTGQFYSSSNPNNYITGLNTGNFITTGQTGNFLSTSSGSVFESQIAIINGLTGTFVNIGQTGQFALNVNLISTGVILQGEINTLDNWTGNSTGIYYPLTGNPAAYITGFNSGLYTLNSATGSFVTTNQTGSFYTTSNPSGYITGISTGNFITTSMTGGFVTTGQTGSFGGGSFNTGTLTGTFALLTGTNNYYGNSYTSGNEVVSGSQYIYISNLTGDAQLTGINTGLIGLFLGNPTSATSGNGIEISPSLDFSGNYWGVTGLVTGVSIPMVWRIYATGISGIYSLANPSLNIDLSTGGNNFVKGISFDYNKNNNQPEVTCSNFIATNGITVTNNIGSANGLFNLTATLPIARIGNGQGNGITFGNQTYLIVNPVFNGTTSTAPFTGYGGLIQPTYSWTSAAAGITGILYDFQINPLNTTPISPNLKHYLLDASQSGISQFCVLSSGASGVIPTGYIGINNSNPQFPLDVSGNARISGTVTTSSAITCGGNITIQGANTLFVPNTNTNNIQPNSSTTISINTNVNALVILCQSTESSVSYVNQVNKYVNIPPTINLGAGSGQHNILNIGTIYNFTGSQTGSCNDLLINTNEVQLSGASHNFIQCQNSGSPKFIVTNSGMVSGISGNFSSGISSAGSSVLTTTFYRAGNVAIGSNATTQAVSFSSNFTGTNYAVSLTPDNAMASANSLAATSKTISGFTISATLGVVGGFNVDYMAFSYN